MQGKIVAKFKYFITFATWDCMSNHPVNPREKKTNQQIIEL